MTMNRTLFAAAIATLGLLFSCSPENDEPNPIELSVANFTISFDENPEIGDAIGTINASANKGELTFDLVSQSETNAIALNSTTGALTVATASIFNYESLQQITAVVDILIQ